MASPTRVSETRRGNKRQKRSVRRSRRVNRMIAKASSTVQVLRELEKSLQ